MAVNGTGVAITLVGVVLTYSGVKGKKISTTIKDLIAGNDPTANAAVDLPILTTPTTGNAGPTGGAGSGSSGGASDNPPKPGQANSGQRLSAAQIYQYARSAGFNPASAVIATAVAFAESGGDPTSYNGKPPDNSYGLWQINMIGSMGPSRRAEFGLSSNDQLFDPATNAHAAYAISSHGVNWQPWTTFTSGAYLQYLPKARAAAGG